jgi:hypothetical protein
LKSTKLILFALALSLMLSPAIACVGARPLAMGGAFAGLADDANATYWNPAGLVQVKGTSSTYMHTSNNRESVNYQDYYALVHQFDRDTVIGVSHIAFNLAMGQSTIDNQDWYWVSAGLRSKTMPALSLGINVRSVENSIPGHAASSDKALDLGLFYKEDDRWSFGLLIQDASQPKTYVDGTARVQYRANWRPGCAFRPDKSSVLSFEIYDAGEGSGKRSFRFGAEKVIGNTLALRVGYYGLGDDDNDGFTFGAGISLKWLQADVAVMKGDLDDTAFISSSVVF